MLTTSNEGQTRGMTCESRRNDELFQQGRLENQGAIEFGAVRNGDTRPNQAKKYTKPGGGFSSNLLSAVPLCPYVLKLKFLVVVY